MRFVTLFPQGSNIHLIKDVGQIPYTLKKEFGVDTALVSGRICMEGTNLDDVPGMEIDNLRIKWCGWKIGSLIYLLENAKKIDWLNLYHAKKSSYYLAKIFKALNRKGKVYLKLDMDLTGCDALDCKKKIQNRFRKYLDRMDLVSVESTAVLERIQKYTKRRILLVPNGYMLGDRMEGDIQKEDIFLTVGRLGTKQKATEILLEAFAQCRERQTWKMRLVGSVEDEFKPYIREYFSKYPELVGRVEFVGEINNRKALAEEYRKAKIFVLPSRWEAFPLVLSEAASQGCKIIVTPSVSSCKDFVYSPEFGEIVPTDDAQYLGETMEKMANSYRDDRIVKEIIAYAEQRFSWKNICEVIFRYL